MIEIISKQLFKGFFSNLHFFFFLRHSCYLLDRPSEEVATVAVVVVTCSYLMGWPQPTWPFRSGRQVI